MRAAKKKKGHGGNRDLSGNVTTLASGNRTKHSPPDIMALCLLLHTAVSAARGLVSRLAMLTDSPPFGLVEAADNLDEAGDLISEIVANGGNHAPE